MARYKVEINPRENCISDMVCVSICPDVFEMSTEDNKSQIVAKYRVDPNNNAVGIVPEDLKGCVEDAATACPVQIIHVTKIEG
ncbi:ferredoxin [Thermogladius sp. 4427co]|uniref:ferredoxin n=1 Tax=Thermogladius sp. 4427co TaxID=3450718 RepID=UPI003F7A8193